MKTAQVTALTKTATTELETDVDPEQISERRVGRVMSLLRFKGKRDGRAKGWIVPVADLSSLVRSHNVRFAFARTAPLTPNGTSGINGITAQGAMAPTTEVLQFDVPTADAGEEAVEWTL